MITAKKIPLQAPAFIRSCTNDVMRGRFAASEDGYLDFLVAETEKRDKRLLNYLRVWDRAAGQARFSADADHIVPRSVWGILMFGFLDRGRAGTSFNVLSNLFWRDRMWNQANDQLAISIIKSEATTVELHSRAGLEWRRKWIEIFLRTKHDEGFQLDADFVDPIALDDLTGPDGGSNWLNRG
jgi:hypothetical protein